MGQVNSCESYDFVQVVKLHLIKQGACQLERVVRLIQWVKWHLIKQGAQVTFTSRKIRSSGGGGGGSNLPKKENTTAEVRNTNKHAKGNKEMINACILSAVNVGRERKSQHTDYIFLL